MRGYAVVALDNPKTAENIGAVLRAAWCYSAAAVIVGGTRYRKHPTDVQKAYKKFPLITLEDCMELVPYGCVPVAVDLVEGAISLPHYQHPERAFYVFGAEDATLGARVLDRCRDRVMVPTNTCMNLAAAVNVILYDRMAKGLR